MTENYFQEIISYLKHKDLSLAVRRMLDLSLDTRNPEFMREAICWSKHYHQLQVSSQEIPGQFYAEGKSLLQKIEQVYTPAPHKQTRLLQAKAIQKKYAQGGFTLQALDVHISNGNVLGVVGENGNGKTTLLRCLAGQLSIDGGSIHYSLLQKPDYYSVKNYVVFIPQRIPRWYGLLKDNLHFSASIAGISGEENELMVAFMLERLNLSEYAELTWDQISSGYRTRFELARILLQKPQLLILDEPLANLDINAQQTILNDLRFLAQSSYNPMGIVLSSQQLHEVEKVADEVIFIKNGNSIFQKSSQTNTGVGTIIEMETSAPREELETALSALTVQIQFNGGFYTIESKQATADQILQMALQHKISIVYFRDISFSTKRYFNA